jgi:peptide/nickel transport system substrate-binding protein
LTLNVQAETFRYAFRIDPASLDPQAIAETFTLSWLGQIYEPLVGRGKKLELIPALATKWEQPDPLTWRFTLRPNVKFHNGEPFTKDGRLRHGLHRQLGEGGQEDRRSHRRYGPGEANPILPYQITSTYMMSKTWASANGADKPASVKAKVENFASTNANDTGPFKVKSRQAGVRTVFEPHEGWWGKKDHNLTEVIFTPIQADATRVAALLSGELDMVYPVPQDVERIKSSGKFDVLQGSELRTIFLNMDRKRDELLESNIKGKNPLKDVRVRKAIYQAIDIQAIKDRVMGGTSHIAGIMITPGITGYDSKLDTR